MNDCLFIFIVFIRHDKQQWCAKTSQIQTVLHFHYKCIILLGCVHHLNVIIFSVMLELSPTRRERRRNWQKLVSGLTQFPKREKLEVCEVAVFSLENCCVFKWDVGLHNHQTLKTSACLLPYHYFRIDFTLMLQCRAFFGLFWAVDKAPLWSNTGDFTCFSLLSSNIILIFIKYSSWFFR